MTFCVVHQLAMLRINSTKRRSRCRSNQPKPCQPAEHVPPLCSLFPSRSTCSSHPVHRLEPAHRRKATGTETLTVQRKLPSPSPLGFVRLPLVIRPLHHLPHGVVPRSTRHESAAHRNCALYPSRYCIDCPRFPTPTPSRDIFRATGVRHPEMEK